MEAVLQSGLFTRAPNLESFFRYVCEHHFLGQAEQLKEYNIAVEALGRAPEFDQKKDSIVRVEAHRLRKRLSEYYAGPGAGHAIHIVIPRGSYAPQFAAGPVEPAPELVETEEPAALPGVAEIAEFSSSFEVPAEVRRPAVGLRWILSVFGFLLLALAIFGLVKWRLVYGSSAESENGSEVWQAASGEIPAEFRMVAGYHGEPFSDAQGRDWHPDAYYTGGRSMTLPRYTVIQCLPSPGFVRTARIGRFRYDIPVREGIYEIHLYFAETEYGIGNPKGGGDGSRLFRLAINPGHEPASSRIDLFDVHSDAGGPNRLYARVFKDISRAADGKIHISFEPIRGTAILNAIEILPSAAGRIRPIRIVAQEHSVTDSDGKVWSADEYVVGGTLVLRHDAKFRDRNSALYQALYQGERFGNFTYHIPLAPGKYRLTLHFAETYFGTPSAAVSRNEHRLFDVYANGVALVRKLDILKEAGAPNKGIDKVFDGLEPNAQGELALQFVPLANYAEVNAIEVIETE